MKAGYCTRTEWKEVPHGSPLSISSSRLFHLPKEREREEEKQTISSCIVNVCGISTRSGFIPPLIVHRFGSDWPKGMHNLIKEKSHSGCDSM